jgi:hypothetical protein
MKFGVAAFRSCSHTNTLLRAEEHFMQPASQAISKSRLWTGRILSAILVLFLLFDAIAKLLRLAPVLQAFDQLGWSRNLAIPLGIVLLTCTLLYMIPNSSALGALLLTAYLGGAVATHLRALMRSGKLTEGVLAVRRVRYPLRRGFQEDKVPASHTGASGRRPLQTSRRWQQFLHAKGQF